MPFSLTRIVADKLLDERVTDITVAPLWSGDALVSYMAADRLHYAYYWWETNTLKVLDDDLFDEDPRKDAGGAIWSTPAGLACLVAHTTDAAGQGVSARLFGGAMPAPWIKDAREYRLKQFIDERARAIVTAALQGGEAGETDHAAEELRAEIDRLKTEVMGLHALVVELQSITMRTAEKVHQAGAAMITVEAT